MAAGAVDLDTARGARLRVVSVRESEMCKGVLQLVAAGRVGPPGRAGGLAFLADLQSVAVLGAISGLALARLLCSGGFA